MERVWGRYGEDIGKTQQVLHFAPHFQNIYKKLYYKQISSSHLSTKQLYMQLIRMFYC